MRFLRIMAFLHTVIMILFAACGLASGQCFDIHQRALYTSVGKKILSAEATIGPIISDLHEGAVPQGIAYVSSQKVILISYYSKNAPSGIFVVNSGGVLEKRLILNAPDGQPHHGHVGGIAVAGQSLFVASEGSILCYELVDILTQSAGAAVTAVASYTCETKASFCTATPGLLLAGEFAYRTKYTTNPSHHLTDRKGVKKYALVCGYKLDDLSTPVCALSVRQKVQGMCVAGDRVYLSVSYGRKKRSQIVVYRNPIGEKAHKLIALNDGAQIPLWFLDGENYIGEIDFPPMSEGIVMIDGDLAVLSESGADKYRDGGIEPIEHVILLNVSTLK